MRYCYHCRRITTGGPLFCNYCGRSYDVKLCPRLHPNPRAAEVCSQCGSSDLSTPQPPGPVWLRPLLFLLTAAPGVFLFLLSLLFLTVSFQLILTNELLLGRFLVLALLLGLLWSLYTRLPAFVRRTIQKQIIGRKPDGHSSHS